MSRRRRDSQFGNQERWLTALPNRGSRKLHRLDENIGAAAVELTSDDLRGIKNAMSQITVQGDCNPEDLKELTNR